MTEGDLRALRALGNLSIAMASVARLGFGTVEAATTRRRVDAALWAVERCVSIGASQECLARVLGATVRLASLLNDVGIIAIRRDDAALDGIVKSMV